MTEEPIPAPGPQPMRASHQDREQVATVLQKAMADGRISVAELESRLDSVYAAKTLAELEPITNDLPGHQLSLSKPIAGMAPAASSAPRVVSGSTGGRTTANLVGIMSGVERKGAWIAAPRINCVAVMGGIELDFTGAQLTGMDTVVNVTAIMGGVEITVPEGITVIVEGVGIMGAFVDNARQTYGREAPVLRVRGLALMGGVEVKARRKAVEQQ
ncbi:hypothetical protein ABIB25_004640 [Nakamurella sp. UYEF19]|uniref:DUF1707 SHOCT-like domain-containing protein n=1 Tax=Nakamurella sp. UYEF19 TaxID=1756392 RepID=UPI00339159EF